MKFSMSNQAKVIAYTDEPDLGRVVLLNKQDGIWSLPGDWVQDKDLCLEHTARRAFKDTTGIKSMDIASIKTECSGDKHNRIVTEYYVGFFQWELASKLSETQKLFKIKKNYIREKDKDLSEWNLIMEDLHGNVLTDMNIFVKHIYNHYFIKSEVVGIDFNRGEVLHLDEMTAIFYTMEPHMKMV